MMEQDRLSAWDPVDYLFDNNAIIGYLAAALEYGDPETVLGVLHDIGRVFGYAIVGLELPDD